MQRHCRSPLLPPTVTPLRAQLMVALAPMQANDAPDHGQNKSW